MIKDWVSTFNRGDADALAELYAEDAVNHQVVRDPVVGRDAIREIFARKFDRATMVCRIENIFQDGDWAILEWIDPKGLRGCGFSRSLTIRSSFREVTSTNCRFSGSRGYRSPRTRAT